jgi:hypothetical protein
MQHKPNPVAETARLLYEEASVLASYRALPELTISSGENHSVQRWRRIE